MPKKPFDQEIDIPRRSSMSDEETRSAGSSITDLDEGENALDYNDEDDVEGDII